MLNLTNRLQLVADCVNPCICMADIGTDHAYLPAWCLLNGKTQFAIAADINPNPLANARQTLGTYGLEERIDLRLSDGLQNIAADEAQEIVVAGMGGNQIADMIENTAWLQDNAKHLILQPMTHFEDVRKALLENGFQIETERTTAEGERLYLVISARYSGEKREYPAWYLYAGELVHSKTKTDCLFLEKILARLSKRATALCEQDEAESARLFAVIKEIEHERRADL
ncbi:MAG: class I SAM-dependent methyltransferase [Candidatus Fimenecus sp.]